MYFTLLMQEVLLGSPILHKEASYTAFGLVADMDVSWYLQCCTLLYRGIQGSTEGGLYATQARGDFG